MSPSQDFKNFLSKKANPHSKSQIEDIEVLQGQPAIEDSGMTWTCIHLFVSQAS